MTVVKNAPHGGHAHRYSPQAHFRRSSFSRLFWDLGRWAWVFRLAVFVLVVAAGLGTLIVLGPPAIIGDTPLTPSARVEAEAQVRTSLLQAAAGLALLMGLVFTARTSQTTRSGHITDRFSKAIEQLGSENSDVRIGGLYALEQIARDSRRYRPVVLEVLLRYLSARRYNERCGALPVHTPDVEPDVQTGLAVLGRRKGARSEEKRLDLYSMDLPGARMDRGVWRQVNGYYSRLDAAHIVDADLRGAGLGWARIRHAFLTGSNLRRASFIRADCTGTFFPGADLRGVDFARANLTRADFSGRPTRPGGELVNRTKFAGAFFEGADLTGADFRGADLTKAKGLTQEQVDVTIMNSKTKLPPGLHLPAPAAPVPGASQTT